MMADRKQALEAASCTRASDRTSRSTRLKPLSVYSHRVFFKAAVSCSVSRDAAPWNRHVECSNSRTSVGPKRRSDDLSMDDGYDTRPKKARFGHRSSTATASCVSDFRQVKLVSPQSSSVRLDGIKRIDKTLSDQKSLDLGWFDRINKNDGQNRRSFSAVHSSSPLISHKGGVFATAFVYDVDDAMCLSPIDGVDRVEDLIRSFQTSEDWSSSGQNRVGATANSLRKHVQTESDEGYVTKSFTKADSKDDVSESEISKRDRLSFIKSFKVIGPNLANGKTPVSIPAVSTLSHQFYPNPLLSPKLNVKKDDRSSSRRVCDVNVAAAFPQSAYDHLYADETKAPPELPFLNVKERKGFDIKHKETSACRNQDERFAKQMEEDVDRQRASLEITVTFQEETAAGDNFNDTPRLQSQVESDVVLPSTQKSETFKAPAHKRPEQKAASEDDRNVIENVARPAVLYSENDWEKKKTSYVDSVTRHINNNGEDGVMTELLHLMNTVANQSRGRDVRTWQHPSDLTRRNYQLHISSRLFSLDDWQNLNFRYHRRFAKVPHVFKRSSVL